MGWSQGPGVVMGGTDNTAIGNTADRIKVDSDTNPTPDVNITYQVNSLLNGAVANMAVNGSVTPQNFSWTPGGSDDIWYVEAVSFLIFASSGTLTVNGFGTGASPLTNGLDLHITQLGTDRVAASLKTNADLTLTFKDHPLQTATTGLFGSTAVFLGEIVFHQPLVLRQANADTIFLRVRDNLSGIANSIQARVRAWRAF